MSPVSRIHSGREKFYFTLNLLKAGVRLSIVFTECWPLLLSICILSKLLSFIRSFLVGSNDLLLFLAPST